jgi:GntR family transcriptional regulator
MTSDSTSEAEVQDRATILREIRGRFLRLSGEGLSKYMQLRRAILLGIEEKELRPGDQLPPEDDLTALGISHGTVRRAMAHLAAGGFISREHGRGTFIADYRHAIDDSWHFRFLSGEQDTILPVYSHIIDRTLVSEGGPWVAALGADETGFTRIKRSFNVDDKFLCYSEFYLANGRFGPILKLPLDRLENANFKKLLQDEFGTTTVMVRQRIRALTLPDEICELLGVGRKTIGILLEIVAYSFHDDPFSYHRIFVPPSSYMLDLTKDVRATPRSLV